MEELMEVFIVEIEILINDYRKISQEINEQEESLNIDKNIIDEKITKIYKKNDWSICETIVCENLNDEQKADYEHINQLTDLKNSYDNKNEQLLAKQIFIDKGLLSILSYNIKEKIEDK